MPKAKPYPGDVIGGDTGEEEEKTTIESQWEDEASTTVEQGEVAEKVRSLKPNGNTSFTHTGSVEEPTVDDQHAPVLSAITPLRADQNARLAITQGNDTGQTFEITPGKTFSVGRAIDNDIVLTDIAVSRRHFELKHEDGAWVVIDHRSGNGTVVNGNVEDNPFMLANGDVIEIGNTVFRFEQDKGPERPQRIHHEDDEEELSTVAGKPLRAEIVDEPTTRPPPVMQPRPARPKTLPPPTPLRSIGASQPPPLGLPPMAPQPASTMPLPQMANRPPATAAPTMLGDSMGMPIGQMPISQLHQPLGSMPPTTIPGQGAPRQSYGYPQATEIPPHSVHAQMLLIQTQNRRGDASTAHVPPMNYDPMGYAQPPAMMQQRYSQPQVSQRAKYIAAAAAIAVVAAIATIAIVKSGDSKKPSSSAKTEGAGSAKPAKKNVTAQPITPDTPKAQVAVPTPQVATTTTATTTTTPKQEPPKKDEVKQAPPKQDPPKQDPPKKEEKQVASSKTTKREKNVAARPQKKEEKKDPAPATKKVAVATGGDTSAARSKADDLYRKRKFREAASVLTAAAKTADSDEAKELRAKADYYTKLGKALNTGEAPAQDAIVAYQSLRSAANYDANVGGFYKSEIDDELGSAASKAAFKYLANKDWQSARTAVIQAENHGAGGSVGTVKTKLESVARDLYGEAQKDGFDSQNSKDMLKQIMVIVDSKSTWYQKAAKAIAANR